MIKTVSVMFHKTL